MKPWLVVVVALAACKGRGDAKKVCEEAGTKYASCVEEILGPEMAAMARSKDGVAACSRDDKTVAMYKKCLPETDCTKFMDCLEGYAQDTLPEIPPGSRKEQCEAHVKDGLRGIALEVVMRNEVVKRDDDALRKAQECAGGDSTPWEACIESAERAEVARYGVLRQTECEAWKPELAACVLRQAGAKDCDPDSYPMWHLPRAEGPPGPRVAWSTDASYDDDDYTEDAFLGWAAGHTLIIKDDKRLRAVQGGKVMWTVEDSSNHFAIAGGSVVAKTSTDPGGLRIWDVATGAATSALANLPVTGFGIAGDRVLAEAEYGLYEVTAGKCTKPTCAKKLAALDEDMISETHTLAAWRGDVVIGSLSSVLVVDRRGKQKAMIRFGDASDVVIHGDNVILGDEKGVAILSLAGCTKQGPAVHVPSSRYQGEDADLPEECPQCKLATPGCVIAQTEVSWVATVTPAAVPGGVAFNDHGIIPRTQFLGNDGSRWSVVTDGHGEVSGDDKYVYTATLGPDQEGPVRVLALDRKTGKVAWQTDLEAKSPEHVDASVAVRDGQLAVQVGPKIYVLVLGT
jgi:hypothetical protein